MRLAPTLIAIAAAAALLAPAAAQDDLASLLLPAKVVQVTVQPVPTALAPGSTLKVRLLDADTAKPVAYECTDVGLAVFPASQTAGLDPDDPTPRGNLDLAVWEVHLLGLNLAATDGVAVVVFPGAEANFASEPGYLWAYYQRCHDAVESYSAFYSTARNLAAGARAYGFHALSHAPTPVFINGAR